MTPKRLVAKVTRPRDRKKVETGNRERPYVISAVHACGDGANANPDESDECQHSCSIELPVGRHCVGLALRARRTRVFVAEVGRRLVLAASECRGPAARHV